MQVEQALLRCLCDWSREFLEETGVGRHFPGEPLLLLERRTVRMEIRLRETFRSLLYSIMSVLLLQARTTPSNCRAHLEIPPGEAETDDLLACLDLRVSRRRKTAAQDQNAAQQSGSEFD